MNRLFGTLCLIGLSVSLCQAQQLAEKALQVQLKKLVNNQVITKDTLLYGESLYQLNTVVHEFLEKEGYADLENFSYSYELRLGNETLSRGTSAELSREESMTFTAYLSQTDFEEQDVATLLTQLQQGEQYAKQANIRETHTFTSIRKDTLGSTRGGAPSPHIIDLNTLTPAERKALLTALKDERVRKTFEENGIVVKGIPEE
ncbi:MAG: hypothetical protein AAF824_09630 [Bacteroidota bacterium]